MTKTEVKEWKKDFIPDGPTVDIDTLVFRRTTENEVHQCCMRTGYDSQSGPMYCGELAEWVTTIEIDGRLSFVCERHSRFIKHKSMYDK